MGRQNNCCCDLCGVYPDYCLCDVKRLEGEVAALIKGQEALSDGWKEAERALAMARADTERLRAWGETMRALGRATADDTADCIALIHRQEGAANVCFQRALDLAPEKS